jgi:hypothetical protein
VRSHRHPQPWPGDTGTAMLQLQLQLLLVIAPGSACGLTSLAVNESRPLVGSSRNRMLGLVMRAMPMLVRLAWPPEMPRFSTLPMRTSLQDIHRMCWKRIGSCYEQHQHAAHLSIDSGCVRPAVRAQCAADHWLQMPLLIGNALLQVSMSQLCACSAPPAAAQRQLVQQHLHSLALGGQRLAHGALELSGVQQHLRHRQSVHQRVCRRTQMSTHELLALSGRWLDVHRHDRPQPEHRLCWLKAQKLRWYVAAPALDCAEPQCLQLGESPGGPWAAGSTVCSWGVQ